MKLPCSSTQNSPPQIYQDRLHGVVPLPLRQAGELRRVNLETVSSLDMWKDSAALYLAILRVHAGNVDFGFKRDLGRNVGVVRAAMDLDAVDAILVDAL